MSLRTWLADIRDCRACVDTLFEQYLACDARPDAAFTAAVQRRAVGIIGLYESLNRLEWRVLDSIRTARCQDILDALLEEDLASLLWLELSCQELSHSLPARSVHHPSPPTSRRTPSTDQVVFDLNVATHTTLGPASPCASIAVVVVDVGPKTVGRRVIRSNRCSRRSRPLHPVWSRNPLSPSSSSTRSMPTPPAPPALHTHPHPPMFRSPAPCSL